MKVVVEYFSKIVNKILFGDMELIVKVLVYGLFLRIVKIVFKCKILRMEIIFQVLCVVVLEMNKFCLKKNLLIFRKISKDDFINFDMKKFCEEWKECVLVFYLFLLICFLLKNILSIVMWFFSIVIVGFVFFK